tara:strand:+ start:1226 stop:1999 length:774 start_codon:yes stop_codon:yes gene_type:complete
MINSFDSKGTYYQLNKKKELPIVLIHGVGLDHEMWEYQFNSFENTVLTYDILGHGKTPLGVGQVTFDDFSEQLINLIGELGIGKIHLVGFSIGSLIARNFATKHNDRLQTLTLLSSIFKRSNQQQKVVDDRFEKSKNSSKMSNDALVRWFTEDYLKKNQEKSEWISSILSRNNMKNFNKIYELFVKHKDDEDFKKIIAETLVMTGEEDVGSTPEMSKNLSKVIKNSKLKIIPKGKHLCSIECVDDVNNAIKEHIKNE